MIKVLSEEEVKKNRQKREDWWSGLDDRMKLTIHNFFEPIVRQMNCRHILEVTGDGKYLYCSLCKFSREKPQDNKPQDDE